MIGYLFQLTNRTLVGHDGMKIVEQTWLKEIRKARQRDEAGESEADSEGGADRPTSPTPVVIWLL